MTSYFWMLNAAGVYHVFTAWRPGNATGMIEMKYDSLCGHESTDHIVREVDGTERCVDCLRKLAKGGRGI